jgi:hypothetical protein
MSHPIPVQHRRQPVTPLSFTKLPFGQYEGLTFDEIPLGYLDWLGAQSWLYGEFKSRLLKYLKKPCIRQELAEAFPDPEDDSRAPLFFSADPGTDSITCNFQCDMRHRWHGQPIPQEEEPRDYTPRPIRKGQRWTWLADLWTAIEAAHYNHELPGCQGLKDLFTGLPQDAINKVRAAYQAARDHTQPPERTTWPIALIPPKPESPDIEILSKTFSRGRGKKRHLAWASAGRRPVH